MQSVRICAMDFVSAHKQIN